MSLWPWLSLSIWVPILGGMLLLAFGRDSAPTPVKWAALLVSVLTLVITGIIGWKFDPSSPALQFPEFMPWIKSFHIAYSLGVDGIALPLVILSALCTVIVVVAAWRVIEKRVPQYYAAFLILQGLMTGAFLATDAMLFYVFWEALLIPMFLIIGIWGGPRRVYATIKFFLYTFLGSIFMLVALIFLYNEAGSSFNIMDFYTLDLSDRAQFWVFWAFLAAFAVKIPMFPVHTWLPDAHVEAPTGGSVILAAIMLKLGGYGFLRFSLPIAPEASLVFAQPMIVLSLIAVIYVGFIAIVQRDMKKLIAYSSIAHMGFATLGIFMAAPLILAGNVIHARMGLEGAMVQMVSHGLISSAMFLCVGVLYDRLHSRDIKDYGGVANVMPVFTAFAVMFAMANVGLPGTSGFVGEFLVILASYKLSIVVAFLAGLTLLLSPAYTLWMVRRVFYGEVVHTNVGRLKDICSREMAYLSVLAIAVIALGVWPAPLLKMMHASITQLAHMLSIGLIPTGGF